MSDCCHPEYQTTFDTSNAKNDLTKFRKKGPKKTTQLLIDSLQQHVGGFDKLLDIGGGIGVISLSFFAQKLSHSTHVDISQASIQVFREEVASMGKKEQVNIIEGDFLDQASRIDGADVVTLDKVICCYQDYSRLVQESAAKALSWYAYIIPRDVWWVKWVHGTGQWFSTKFGNRFRSYIHPESTIERIVTESGFEKIHQQHQGYWVLVLYKRIGKSE